MTFESPLPAGWPWPNAESENKPPLWTLEEFFQDGCDQLISCSF
jgi:hypothetical protein